MSTGISFTVIFFTTLLLFPAPVVTVHIISCVPKLKLDVLVISTSPILQIALPPDLVSSTVYDVGKLYSSPTVISSGISTLIPGLVVSILVTV